MDFLKRPSRRHFTKAAQVAAAEARRRKREAAVPRDVLEVFIVRRSSESLDFGWEIRRFGAVVIEKSQSGFGTTEAAKRAGGMALAEHGAKA